MEEEGQGYMSAVITAGWLSVYRQVIKEYREAQAPKQSGSISDILAFIEPNENVMGEDFIEFLVHLHSLLEAESDLFVKDKHGHLQIWTLRNSVDILVLIDFMQGNPNVTNLTVDFDWYKIFSDTGLNVARKGYICDAANPIDAGEYEFPQMVSLLLTYCTRDPASAYVRNVLSGLLRYFTSSVEDNY